MADKKISQLTAAAALTGSEPIPTVQGGVTVQTTAQDIADLAAGGGGTPAGSDTQIQYNNAGAFGADTGFTRDGATGNTNISAIYGGTDTFGYQISDNLLGNGITGSVNTYTNVAGDLGVSGLLKQGSDSIKIGNTIQLATGEASDITIMAGAIDLSVYDGVPNETKLSINSTEFSLTTDLSAIRYGISQSAGVVSVGDTSGGNNTKISIDDVNEHITISNLPAYDDDTAAGVGGLTTGMVYMTTGSGSAPLNAAGILMIKQ